MPDELGDELALLGGEDAHCEKSPKAANCMHGDGAGGIVDGDSEFEHFDQQRRGDAGNDAGRRWLGWA